MTSATDTVREKALSDYRKKLLEHKELEARLKESKTNHDYNIECYSGAVFVSQPNENTSIFADSSSFAFHVSRQKLFP